ncbi:MAG: hypothetical protein MOB07_09305 [Acidobacteria bacterium]|nr:hypothetical protein [Acidobacteriota bacterium]
MTPQPIEGISISNHPAPLSSQQVAQWEQQWGALTEKFEMADGAGKSWTKDAGANGTRQLTQEYPGPQTIYTVNGHKLSF